MCLSERSTAIFLAYVANFQAPKLKLLVTMVLAIVWNSHLALSNKSNENFPWPAFGDMRGYFEPCGCDPTADLGGVLRISAFLEREKTIHRNVLILNTGNNLIPSQDAPFFKNIFLIRALKKMTTHAYLYNYLEQLYAKRLGKELTNLPLVLSNAPKTKGHDMYRPIIRSHDAEIYGYVSPALSLLPTRRFDNLLS